MRLPFHRTLHLPRPDGTGEWRLRLEFAAGHVRARVVADDTPTVDRHLPDPTVPGSTFYPTGMDTGGTVSATGPFPTLGG